MLLKVLNNSFLKNLSNIPGWHIKTKLISIESDDWGSIRMPSVESILRLEGAGLDLRSADAERYNLNDNLATSSDLQALFEILRKYRDSSGNHPVFTPVTIVANPDFKRISDSGFKDYFYEPFTETLKRFPGCENAFELWNQGISERLFVPQMHGREHLNVLTWMKALKSGDRHAVAAFKEGLWGFVPSDYPRSDYQAAFLPEESDDLEFHKTVIKEGLSLFRQIFGYNAEYFVPPNGVFNNMLNDVLFENGIKLRYAPRIQNEPLGMGRSRKRFHWLGKRDRNGIMYIVRNCFFEPNQGGKNWVESCLNDINTAFKWHKPAIISTHRTNYVGSLNLSNREIGISNLDLLLQSILHKWPDALFITTPELGNLMKDE